MSADNLPGVPFTGEAALGLTPDIVLLTDEQGLIVYANPAVESRLGYSPQELLGRLLGDIDTSFYDPRRYTRWWNTTRDSWQHYDTHFRHRDRHDLLTEVRFRRIEYQARPLQYLICRDLSQEQAGASLFHSNVHEVEVVARHIHEVLWITTADRQHLVYVSPAYDKLFGQTREELFANFASFMEMFHPDDAERAAADLSRMGVDDHVGEYRFFRQGELRWVRIRAVAIRDDSGQITSYCGISEDITDRKQSEEAIRLQSKRQAALARFSRLANLENRLDKLMQELTQLVSQTLDSIFCTLCEADPATHNLKLRSMWAAELGHVPTADLDELDINAPGLISLEALTTGEAAVATNLKARPDLTKTFFHWLGMKSAIAVPVRLKDDVYGTLSAGFSTQRHFTEEDVNFLESLGSVLAGAIQRQRTLTQLSDSELRFRTLFESTPDVILVVDKHGMIEMSNRAGLAQREGEPLVGSSSFECLHPSYRQRYQEALDRCLGQGEADDFEHIGADNSWWHARACPLVLGGKSRVLIISANIHPRKQAELDLQKDRELLRQLLEHHERERQLIAYEIHDGMVQHMTGALMHLEAFTYSLEKIETKDQATLDLVMKLLRESISEARRLIGGLRPPILDESGIVAAIDYLISELEESSAISVSFEHALPNQRLHATLESTVFRIVQEALNNAVRHGKSEKATVTLRTDDQQWLHLTIQDIGTGFDPEQVPTSRYGLRGMLDRARLIGGHARISSSPGAGTTVEAHLPLIDPLTA